MAFFAIGDLHLSLGGDKPMDIFGGWENYVERLGNHWRASITDTDTVVLAGDTSWAMSLDSACEDFAFIHALPGRKLLLKGNHDYWWTTRKKMETWLEQQGFDSIGFIHNSFENIEGVSLCGTRGWMNEPNAPHDAKVMAREAGRLRFSLQAAAEKYPEDERLVFLHYPPIYPGSNFEELLDIMAAFDVKRCFYGHLHGNSIARAIQGRINGIEYRLISADAIDFKPIPIGT